MSDWLSEIEALRRALEVEQQCVRVGFVLRKMAGELSGSCCTGVMLGVSHDGKLTACGARSKATVILGTWQDWKRERGFFPSWLVSGETHYSITDENNLSETIAELIRGNSEALSELAMVEIKENESLYRAQVGDPGEVTIDDDLEAVSRIADGLDKDNRAGDALLLRRTIDRVMAAETG